MILFAGRINNAGFLEANTATGLRRCLAEEFNSIYVFHLRGNARTSGEQRRKEKDNVFGTGSRAPIAVSLLVKNPHAREHGGIFFHDIGDYLSRDEKFTRLKGFGSIAGISEASEWKTITPDVHGDWLSQRDTSFSRFTALGNKKDDSEVALFANYSNGVKTNRDAWAYNFSRRALTATIKGMIDVYNSEVNRYVLACAELPKSAWPEVDAFIEFDSTQMSWTREVKLDLSRQKHRKFQANGIVAAVYRPFSKNWMYFNQHFNNCVYQMPLIFPSAASENIVIQINAKYDGNGCPAIISNAVPDLHCNGDSQCFPLYLYDDVHPDEIEAPQVSLLTSRTDSVRTRRDAITDAGLTHFQSTYPDETISKEDLFYYVYGLLHSPDYRERYADNLSKELPRIPRVRTAADFWAFSKAGRDLADLHLNYETVAIYEGASLVGAGGKPFDYAALRSGRTVPGLADADYRVEKMKYGKRGKDKDLTTLIYNAKITVTGIPLEAYYYVVNGKPALDWVVERQCVKTDKDSGIVNDANDWAIETMNNPRYPLELFLRVITVSLETMKIVRALPALDILPN